MTPTAKDFSSRPWWTPNQIRDSFFFSFELTTEYIKNVRALALAEEIRRKELPKEFIKCCRCYGHHGQLENIDGLCEKCEADTAPFRYEQKLKSKTL